MNVFDTTLEKHEDMFITYDTIFVFKEIWLYENVIRPKFNYYKKYMNIEPLQGLSRAALIRIFLERKEKDFIKWLCTSIESQLMMMSEFSRYHKTFKDSIPTDFGRGILNLMMSKNVSHLTIAMDTNDMNALNIINDSFGDYVSNRVFIVNNDTDTILDYIKNNRYTLIATDETELISKHMQYLEGKTICIPYTGYNFDIQNKEYDEPLLISKDKWEFKSIEYKFNLGFVEVYKIIDEMFHMG